MKRIFFTFNTLVFIVFFISSLCFAQETVTLTTYYPPPYGVYQNLRLYPTSSRPTCDANSEGLIYYDNGTSYPEGLYYCKNSAWQILVGDYWTQSGNNLYPNQTTWNVGIGTSSPRARLELGNDGAILAIGAFNSGWIEPNLGAGTRLLWYPRKATFRGAGYVEGTQLDDANIGDYSVALGYNNTARGGYSTVSGGNYSTASGNYSTVSGGNGNTASGSGGSTVSGGIVNTASNSNSTVSGGNDNSAGGDGSTVSGGISNNASGNYSTVNGGYFNTAGGDYSWVGGAFMLLTVNARRTFVWGYRPNLPFSIDTSNAFLIDPPNYSSGAIKVGMGRVPSTNKLEVEGNASKTVGGAWATNSDIRIKKDIHDIKDALKVIRELRPVKFRYTEAYKKAHPSVKDHYYYSFIAQEFQKIFPDSVQKDGEGYLQMDSYPVTPYLVSAVQELSGLVEQLKAKNEALKKRITALENRRSNEDTTYGTK